jgi:pyridoxine 5-phosphate synthase
LIQRTAISDQRSRINNLINNQRSTIIDFVIHLSVNVNKIATVRNSRGGHIPSVLDAVRVCVDAGVSGITVHPRADERHITRTDVYEVASALEKWPALDGSDVEFNIEGDPRPELLEIRRSARSYQ